MTNVHIIFARSKLYEQRLYAIDSLSNSIFEGTNIQSAVELSFDNNCDLCLVYVFNSDADTSLFLESPDLLKTLRNSLYIYEGKPCNVTIRLLNNFGYMLRL